MKLKGALFSILLLVLTYLSFIENISINIGDDNTYISGDEWFEEKIILNNKAGISNKEEAALLDVLDFEKYLLNMKKTPFHRHRITYLDTTGDGNNEEIHSVVSLNENGCVVSNYILKDGEVIWQDDALINKDLAKSLIADADFVDDYGPYALFYIGLSESNFIDDLKKDRNFDERKKQLLRSLNEGQNLSDLYNSALSKDIDNYQGRYLFKMCDGLKQIYIWDEDEDEFKCIHKNKSILS